MKKKWLLWLMILIAAIVICLFVCHLNSKNEDSVPDLKKVVFMDQAQAQARLKGYRISALTTVWGEPTVADTESYRWECGSTALTVYYKWEKVVSCAFVDTESIASEETASAENTNDPQVMIDGKIYYYHGDGYKNDLPKGSQTDNIGAVEKVDNRRQPNEDWMACHLPMGQVIARDENGNLYLVSGGNMLRLTCES